MAQIYLYKRDPAAQLYYHALYLFILRPLNTNEQTDLSIGKVLDVQLICIRRPRIKRNHRPIFNQLSPSAICKVFLYCWPRSHSIEYSYRSAHCVLHLALWAPEHPVRLKQPWYSTVMSCLSLPSLHTPEQQLNSPSVILI